MNQIKVAVLFYVVLCILLATTACNNNIDDSVEIRKYDIISVDVVESSRQKVDLTDKITYYEEYWNITNNSDELITGITITVCFCDKNNTIIDTDCRTSMLSLKPGQTIQIYTSTDKQYVTSYISNYEYEKNSRWIEVDLIAQSVA